MLKPRSTQAQVKQTSKQTLVDSPQTPQQTRELGLILFVSVYLYFRLFSFSGIPYLNLATSDQAYFWQYALRLMHGEHVYHDFFQFTPPGLDLYFLTLFRIFGAKVWVTALAAILLGIALSLTCFTLAARFLQKTEALLTALFFIVFAYGGRLDVTHHWFSLIASLSAVALIMEGRSGPRLLAAGLLLAVASSFTQTAGVAVGFGILLSLAWEHVYGKSWNTIFRNQALLVASFGVAWLTLNSYFLATAGWKALWYLQVIYPWHYIDHTRGFLIPPLRRGGGLAIIQPLFIYLLLVVVYPWVLWRCWRRRRAPSKNDMQSVLLAAAGLSLLLSVITRANWTRLYAVSMPAIILGMKILRDVAPAKLRRWALWGMCGIIACLAILQIRRVHRQRNTVLDLYGGTMAVAEADVEVFQWLQKHTKPGDEFLEATWPGIYLPLGLRSPVFVETLLPERTSPEFVALTIHQIDQSKVRTSYGRAGFNPPRPTKSISCNRFATSCKRTMCGFRSFPITMKYGNAGDVARLTERISGNPCQASAVIKKPSQHSANHLK